MANVKKGYDPDFLGSALNLPVLPKKTLAPLLKGNGSEVKNIHYSAFVHKDRWIPFMTASNIKGEGYNAPKRDGGEPWDYSEQMDKKYQLNNSFYSNDENTFDRGHIVRRVDPCWGSDDVAAEAEVETFRWVNCTPQHKRLNQRGGIWFELEQHVMENGVKEKIANICVFAGPVLKNDDKALKVKKGQYKDQYIQIPIEFWKIIVWQKSDGKLYAVGFLMSQWEFIKSKMVEVPSAAPQNISRASKPKLPDEYFENLKFKDHQTYQVPISAIEKKTGISFKWTNVKFPYTAKKAKIVKATPVRNKYTFATIENKMRRLKAIEGLPISTDTVKRFVQRDETPLSETQVKKAVKKGYAAAIKRYTLKNVTL